MTRFSLLRLSAHTKILATTAAQVNYWARVIQALGVPPVGFTDSCPLPLG